MSNVLLESNALESLSLTRFKRNLGTPADRKVFVAAIADYQEFGQLAGDVRYPRRHIAVEKRLRELGCYPEPSVAERVFELQLEADRAQFSEFLGRQCAPRLLVAITPTLAELDRKLIQVLRIEADKADKAERAFYAEWGVTFDVPPLAKAIRGMIDANLKGMAELGPARNLKFCGEDIVAILNEWFSEPLAIE